MRDRAKILVGNREVAKRYIGSRLVWENNSSLILEFEYKSYSKGLYCKYTKCKFNGY